MRTQLKILLLLVDVLVVLAIYAISPMDWAIANNELRKVNFKIGTDTTSTTVTAQGDGVSVDAPASTASSDGSGQTASVADLSTTQAAQHPKVKDTGKQRFLFFGDSMLEGLSRRLCDYAAHNGHEQRTVLWYSSTSEKWATTNTLDYYIREVQPTFIICCLCSNELFVRDLDRRDKFIATIVRKMGDIPFVWISPPNWKDDTGINALIVKHVGKERYFDSTHLTLARGKDKAHPTFEAAAHWFDLVAEWLESDQTAHPIVMEKPTQKVKWSHVTMLQPNDPGK